MGIRIGQRQGAATLTGDVTGTVSGVSMATTLAATSNATIGSLDKTAGVAIKGSNTNDTASAGYVGEVIESKQSTATNLPGATTVFGNMVSISLTAGTWLLHGIGVFSANGATVSFVRMSIDTTTNGAGTRGDTEVVILPPTSASNMSAVISGALVKLSATTTYYLNVAASFTVATPQYQCRLTAQRIR